MSSTVVSGTSILCRCVRALLESKLGSVGEAASLFPTPRIDFNKPRVLKVDKGLLKVPRVEVREVRLRELQGFLEQNPLPMLESSGELGSERSKVNRFEGKPKLPCAGSANA